MCEGAALRMMSGPRGTELARRVQEASRRYPVTHLSPLNQITHMVGVQAEKVEVIRRLLYGPTWRPRGMETRIAESKEEAEREIRDVTRGIEIYTDGSAQDGGVGAAAVMLRGHREPWVARKYLGKTTEHTVFEAECVGILMALGKARKELEKRKAQVVHIMVDNQAAIRRLGVGGKGPGDWIVKKIHKEQERIYSKFMWSTIELHWTPGHMGIQGNETADTEAKQAAEGARHNRESGGGGLCGAFPISRSAWKAECRTRREREWVERARESPRYTKFASIDPKYPKVASKNEIDDMPKRDQGLIHQLRTGHIPLNAYLHRFQREERNTCPRCLDALETVNHFLFACVATEAARRKLRGELEEGKTLGEWVLGDRRMIKEVVEYAKETRRWEAEGYMAPR